MPGSETGDVSAGGTVSPFLLHPFPQWIFVSSLQYTFGQVAAAQFVKRRSLFAFQKGRSPAVQR